MRHSLRTTLFTRAALLLVVPSLLAACSGPMTETGDEATPGCLGGNRSECVVQFALGTRFGCARMHDRSVWCWGENDESQLGYPTVDLCPVALPDGQTRSVACHTYPFQVQGLSDVTAVAAGDRFACALKGDQTVACWGANDAGQLGTGGVPSSVKPLAIPGLQGVTGLALGARHACALVGAGGAVWCWGADDSQQLGVAAASMLCSGGGAMVPCETAPHAVPGLSNAVAIAAGARHTCVAGVDGSVWCFGANDLGQLGQDTASDGPIAKPQAVRAHGLTRFAASIVAGSDHTCTVRDDGAVFCWGRNDHGELGIPPTMPPPDHCAAPCSPSPLLVASLPGAPRLPDLPPDLSFAPSDGGIDEVDLAVATPPDLALPPPLQDGGTPSDLLGVGPDLAAVPVGPPPSPPRALAAGGFHTCARLEGGTLRCWGGNASGELGDGSPSPAPHPPSVVIAQPGAAADNPLAGVTAIAAGAVTGCGRLSDGSLRCWGSSEAGGLGDGDLAPRSGPVPVAW